MEMNTSASLKKDGYFNFAMVISVRAEGHHVTPSCFYFSNTLETQCLCGMCRESPDLHAL